MAETLRGTSQEVEELRNEVGRVRGGGLAATKLAVMDEAGDVWYGAQCYVVAYQEQRQRAVTTWSEQAKQATIVKQWRWRAIMTRNPDEETRSRAVAKINTLYKLIKDRGAGSDYFEKAIVRNEIRACLEGTMVSAEQAPVASWLKTVERTLALHAEGKISRAQADFAWKRAKRGALKSMVHLVHTKTDREVEHAEDEIVQARLNRIDIGDPKMAKRPRSDLGNRRGRDQVKTMRARMGVRERRAGSKVWYACTSGVVTSITGRGSGLFYGGVWAEHGVEEARRWGAVMKFGDANLRNSFACNKGGASCWRQRQRRRGNRRARRRKTSRRCRGGRWCSGASQGMRRRRFASGRKRQTEEQETWWAAHG